MPYELSPRSQLYCKYRLCCTLQKGCLRNHDQVDMSFIDFMHFEKGLGFTIASSLIAVWVSCEGQHLGVKQQWASQHTIRTHCTCLPFLSDLVSPAHWGVRNRVSCFAGNWRWRCMDMLDTRKNYPATKIVLVAAYVSVLSIWTTSDKVCIYRASWASGQLVWKSFWEDNVTAWVWCFSYIDLAVP